MVLGGSAYGITLLRGSHSVAGFDGKHRQIEQLERENEKLLRENEAKRTYLEDLRQNPDHLKLKIQDSYKLVSPGTKEFIVQDGTHEDTPAKPRP